MGVASREWPARLRTTLLENRDARQPGNTLDFVIALSEEEWKGRLDDLQIAPVHAISKEDEAEGCIEFPRHPYQSVRVLLPFMEGCGPRHSPGVAPYFRVNKLGAADSQPGQSMTMELDEGQIPARCNSRNLHRPQGGATNGPLGSA